MRNPFRNTFVLTALLVFVAAGGLAGPAERPGWKLTFDDEFDGTSLDLNKWKRNDPWGWELNTEMEAYVPDAFEVRGGVLRIKAQKRLAFYGGKWRSITSGMISTVGKFSQEYGRFEIRCRAPKGKGMWPGFWLLPIPRAVPWEIDVLEILGHEPNKVYMTQHYPDAQKKNQTHGGSWSGPDFSADFHEFAIEWSPQRIVWFVDGVERFRSEADVPKGQMFVIVNLAVGGSWPGPPDAQTKFPGVMEVDYVRVYQKAQ